MKSPVALLAAALLTLAGAGVRAQEIAPQTVHEHIVFLASDDLRGRGSGERGNERAARYIAEEFARYGLTPVGVRDQRDTKSERFGGGYFQPFTFPAGVATGKGTKLTATISGKTRGARLGSEFEAHPLSGSGVAEGTVAFVGSGAQESDYADVQVGGRVVALLAGSGNVSIDIPGRAAMARNHGAKAVLVIPASDGADALMLPREVSGADAGLPVLLVRRPVIDRWLKDAGSSLEALEAQKKSTVLPAFVALTADIQKVEKVTANVAGLLEGSDPSLKGEVVVVGAHLDHLGMGGAHSLAEDRKPAIHHGADDNASGTAGVLALAQALSRPENRPRRSVLFLCFSGEELGLLGSAHYVKHPLLPLERTVAMVNMDMIGRMKDNKLTIIGTGTGSTWNALLEGLKVGERFALSRDESGFGGSDHQSFYGAKIPVLFFFTGIHPDYHRPSDTIDKINDRDTARVVSLVGETVRRIADSPERPVYQQVAAAASPGRTRARASLGTIPEYGADVVGVLIGGVRAGSPAEAAGIKAGDVLVEFAGSTVRNIEEYTFALSEHQPGETVTLKVKRDGKIVELKATLAESRR